MGETTSGTTAAQAAAADGPTAGELQYLTFSLGEEEYGIEILRVQEIRRHSAITPVPNAPHHVLGVMNLRGTVIPVVDLRSKLALAPAEGGNLSVIVVVNVGLRITGLIVDGVSDVLSVRASDIQAPPTVGTENDAGWLQGIARAAEKLVVLLDIERVLAADVLDGGATASATGVGAA